MKISIRINAGNLEERPHPDLISSVYGLLTVYIRFHEYGEWVRVGFV